MSKPGLGFVLGKFMPPHQGHVYMCEFARNYCEKLVILVCSLPNEPIPGELRYRWMKEMFPDCTVLHETRDLPQEPVGEDPEFWRIWGEVVHKACHKYNKYTPDVVFASENYGHKLAESVGAQFVPVDINRTARNISGTAVRNDPFGNWDYIPQVVRPYFVKKVTLFGPESTGKSTLATELGDYYQTMVVPEYGRTYTETFGPEVDAADLMNIVAGHQASVAAAKRQANKILIEDTDPVMTAVWSDMLLGKRDPWFDSFQDHSDLYLLCDVDIPWEDDGTRYFKDEESRFMFFKYCEDELIKRKVNYCLISGSRSARFIKAKWAIDRLMCGNN